jgi:tetratricopeptide (TPR) repeat protein
MDNFEEIRRDRTAQEVEGYLQLVVTVTNFCGVSDRVTHRVLDRAIQALDRLDWRFDADTESTFLRGKVYRVYRRYEEAIHCLNQVRYDLHNDLHVWLALAWCYKRVNRIDMAIESLEEALLINPSQAIIHFNLACYWSLEENVEQAVTHLRNSLEIDPDFRDLIEKEADFDPIREHSEFLNLVDLLV